MSFFQESGPVATGWASIGANMDRLYPTLDARKPRQSTPSDDDMPSPSGSGTASEESSTEETPEPAPFVSEIPTRMNEESSDDEAQFPDVRVRVLSGIRLFELNIWLTSYRTCLIAMRLSHD